MVDLSIPKPRNQSYVCGPDTGPLSRTDHRETDENYKTARKALSEAEVKLNTVSAEVKRLTEKHSRFMEDGIEAKAAEFAHLSELEDAAWQVSERLTALKSELSELTSRYDTLKQARRETADIVRDALEFYLASLSDKQSLRERIRLIQRKVEALGELDENFDFKKFRNEMSDYE